MEFDATLPEYEALDKKHKALKKELDAIQEKYKALDKEFRNSPGRC